MEKTLKIHQSKLDDLQAEHERKVAELEADTKKRMEAIMAGRNPDNEWNPC